MAAVQDFHSKKRSTDYAMDHFKAIQILSHLNIFTYFTLILIVAFLLVPSRDLTVIVTVPFFFPFTTPLEDTVAILVLLELHTTLLLALLVAVTFAFSFSVFPFLTVFFQEMVIFFT